MHNRRKIAVTIAFLVLITAFSLEITNQYGHKDSFKDIDDMLIELLGLGGERQIIVGKPIGILDYKEEEHVFEGIDISIGDPDFDTFPYTSKSSDLVDLYQANLLGTNKNKILADLISARSFSLSIKEKGAINKGKLNLPGTVSHFLISFPSELFPFDKIIKKSYEYQNYISNIIKDQGDKQSAYDSIVDASLFGLSLLYSSVYDPFIIEKMIDFYEPVIPDEDYGFSTLLQNYIDNNYVLSTAPGTLVDEGVTLGGCVDLTNADGTINEDFIYSWSEPTIITPICNKDYELNEILYLSNPLIPKKYAIICEQGTTIDMVGEGKFSVSSGNIIAGCTFTGSNTPFVSISLDNNIEIFGNTFQTTGADFINYFSLNSNDANPTFKLIKNTFETTDGSIGKINIGDLEDSEGFHGNVLIAKNTFKNTEIMMKGYKDENSIINIINNEFNKQGDITYVNPALQMKDISGGVIYGNTFTNIDNGIEAETSSNLMFVDNHFSEVDGDVCIDLTFISNSIFSDNKINGYGIGIKTVANFDTPNFGNVYLENIFEDNSIGLLLGYSDQTTIAGNEFTYIKEIPGNGDVSISHSQNTVLYENEYPEHDEFIFVSNSYPNYFYGVDENLVYLKTKSDVYFHYPITIKVFDVNNKPLDNAQVVITDSVGNIVSKYLTGPAGWPINEDQYYYAFTKSSEGPPSTKSYKYSVFYNYGEEEDLEVVTGAIDVDIEPGEVSGGFIKIINSDIACTSPPTISQFQFRVFNQETDTYQDILPETIIDPASEDSYMEYYITEDTNFCSGTYNMYDLYNDPILDPEKGALIVAEDDVTITCDNTEFVGMPGDDYKGAGLYSDKDGLVVDGCTFKNYDIGMIIEGSLENEIKNNKFLNNDKGLQLKQLDGSTQAEIFSNEFKGNNDHLEFIDPANVEPSLIYHNNFYKPGDIFIGGLDGNKQDHSDEIMLFKCEDWDSVNNICNIGGSGNYWGMYPNSQKQDKYVNFKSSYTYGVDDQACPLVEPSCDGFYDTAFPIGLDGGFDDSVLDKYPYKGPLSDESFAKTSASVEIIYDTNLDLEAKLTIPETETPNGISYNWLVKEEGANNYEPFAEVNYFFDELGEGIEIDGVIANSLKDYSGNYIYGMVYGDPIIANDCVGNCYEFDGVDDYVVVGSNNLELEGDFTIEMLVNYDDSGFGTIFHSKPVENDGDTVFGVTMSQNSFYPKWGVYIEDTNKIKSFNDLTTDNLIFEEIEYQTGWNYITITYNFEEKLLYTFLNGVLAGTLDYTNSDIEVPIMKGPFYLGQKQLTSPPHYNFKGKLDEFKIYDHALTSEQIQKNYESLFTAGVLNPTPTNSFILNNQHGDCGDWKVETHITTDTNILLDLSQDLVSSYEQLPCGKIPCNADIYPNAIDCVAPQTCQNNFCEYVTCINDSGCIGEGEICEFGKCLICVDPSTLQDTLVIEDDTILCGGTFNFINPENGLIQITENNVNLKCMDETELVGPNEAFGSIESTAVISAQSVENIEISNCKISNFNGAISLNNVTNAKLDDNVLSNNAYALQASDVSGLDIGNNLINNNHLGIGLIGNVKDSTIKNTDLIENQVNLFTINGVIENIAFEECMMNESNFTKPIHVSDSSGLSWLEEVEEKDMILAGYSGSLIKFKNSFYNPNDVYFYDPYNVEEDQEPDEQESDLQELDEDASFVEQLIYAKELAKSDSEAAFGICKNLDDELVKNNCIISVAKISKKSEFCGEISDDVKKDACYMHFVSIYYDYSLCDNIVNELYKNSCKDFEKLSKLQNVQYNTELHTYWSLGVNVIDSVDSNKVVPNVGIEILVNDELVDLNGNGVIEIGDGLVTDENGFASTYLLANITDKTLLPIETVPEYKIFATNPIVVNAVATAGPFFMVEPKIVILDLEAGQEFVITNNNVNQVSQSSGGGGGGSNNKMCIPELDDSCKKKYDITPCVIQGDMNYSTKVYTCLSTNGCGTMLFVEPCEGNAPAFSSGCNNKVRDLLEDGVDCGGPCSAICSATCEDKKQNQGETDTDCGGKCDKCLDDYGCNNNNDCISGYCKSGICKQPTCYDSIMNQDEEQVDCGGNVCASCGVEATCYDGIRNQGEVNSDCGGPCNDCVGPVLTQPKGFNYYWLLLLLIPLIGGLLGTGYFVYSKGRNKKIPSMGKIPDMNQGLKAGIPPMDNKLIKEKAHNKSKDKILKKEIKLMLGKGKTKHEIIEKLNLKYPEDRIKLIFEQSLHDILPKKYEQQLKEYVNHYYAKGLTKPALKNVLIEAGWSKKIINKMIK
jgi:hypothetical protein